MTSSVYFCKSWFRAKKRPTQVWSEAEARGAHANGELYTVLVDSLERPSCFLDVTARLVGVGFLDSLLRETVTYHFSDVEDGRLFLSMATYREFVGDSDQVSMGATYNFDHDGTVHLRRTHFLTSQVETSTSSTDVSKNYSPKPAFGEYEDLVRLER